MGRYCIIFFLIISLRVGAQAPEPLAQPAGMQFAAVKSFHFIMSFTATNADGYLILKSEKHITDVPADGIVYEKGQGLLTSKVMYVGPNTVHNVREVFEGTKYHFRVYAYNGNGNTINYLQLNPLTDSLTTPASSPNGYYDDVHPSSASFIGDLTYLIRNHTTVAYSAYRTNIIPAIFERDTIGNMTVVNCEYSDTTTMYSPPFDFVVAKYNREHALPRSWMHSGGSTSNPDGADYFNLLLTRDIPNNTRSNYPLGIVLTVTQSFGKSKLGLSSNGTLVFEPRDDRKGDAARAIFYQMICYNGSSGIWGFDFMPTFASQQDQQVLKLWHQQDPPDRFEKTKNDYIATIQFNRNPFIDYPNWVDCVNFDSLVKTPLCPTISSLAQTQNETRLSVYPNPAQNVLYLDLSGTTLHEVEAHVFNVVGNEMKQEVFFAERPYINLNSFPTGNYILRIVVNGQAYFSRFVIMN